MKQQFYLFNLKKIVELNCNILTKINAQLFLALALSDYAVLQLTMFWSLLNLCTANNISCFVKIVIEQNKISKKYYELVKIHTSTLFWDLHVPVNTIFTLLPSASLLFKHRFFENSFIFGNKSQSVRRIINKIFQS